MNDRTVSQLADEEAWRKAYPVMHELRTHLSEEQYLELLRDMTGDGYRLFALEENGEIKALAGIAQRTNFYYGHYIYVYDLITTERGRSRGYGEHLLRYVEDLARNEGCQMVALASGVQRKDAHRFYKERMHYDMPSYTFTRVVGEER